MSKSAISYILFFVFGSVFTALAQPTFYAHIDQEKVYAGGVFQLEFQLSDARGSNFIPPPFAGFKVTGGPARSYQTTIVNGRANSYESYTYTLQALKEGRFTIPPAKIKVGGKVIQTRPIQVTVLPPLQEKDLLENGAPSDEDFFLVADLNNDTAFVGQQITLDYRIFTKKNIDKVDFRAFPDLSDFYWQNVHLINERAEQVTISGEQYTTKLLKRFTLFPKRSNVYDITPAQMLVMIPKTKKRGFFFDNYNTTTVNSNILKLLIKPLPGNAPNNDSGLVGNYSMESSAATRHLTTDDAITVRMRIKGNGDANRMTVQPIVATSGLEFYDPKIISQNNDQKQKKQDHFAVIEYLYTTSKPGTYYVQPSFTYFDVDSSAYITLKSDSIQFHVTKGNGLVQSASIDTAIVYSLVNATATKPATPWVQNLFVQIGWLGMLFAALGLSFFHWNKLRLARQAPAKTKSEITLEQLSSLTIEDPSAVAHRIEEILGDYFRDRLSISETDWSTQNLKTKLPDINYPTDKIDELITLLKQCEFAAYSGMTKHQQENWVAKAIELVKVAD